VLWTDCSDSSASAPVSSGKGGVSATRSPSEKKRSLTLPPPDSIQLSEECLVTTLLIVKVLNNIARSDLALIQVCCAVPACRGMGEIDCRALSGRRRV
jgi:hypothetical protein